MPQTLLDLKTEARRRRAAGNLVGALKVYRLVLEGAPLDFDLRFEIADALLAAKEPSLAAPIYFAVAQHDLKSGNPLRALVAIKQLEGMRAATAPLVAACADKYGAGSQALGRSVKPAPSDLSARVRDDLDLDCATPDAQVVQELAQMAAYTGNIQNYPPLVPPIPVFSTLERDAFAELVSMLELVRCESGRAIIRQGVAGDAVYFLARGDVEISRRVEGGEELGLARLGPGSLFGEMALVSSDPRSASVICDGEVDVLELKRERVDEVAARMPGFAAAMSRFTRDRIIANLLATNPLFKPFDEATRKQLLARFTGHEVPRGTIFIEQGQPGNGLYLILQGKAEVLRWDGASYVSLAALGPGDAVGEISLIHEQPATATVKTTTAATLLFMARELFIPLVEAVPELLAHFARLSQERLDDAEFKLMRNSVVDDDFIEDLEETELEDEEIVLI
jgi:CRP-like cAMP-binding protein